MAKNRRKRTNVYRATASQYNYPEREEFQKVLQRVGYSDKTAYALVTGIANPKGSTFLRARELWLEHMNGQPYPGSTSITAEQKGEGSTPPTANFNVNEDVPLNDSSPLPEGKLTEEKMKKGWKQGLAHSSGLKQAAKVKSPIHVTVKVSKAIKDILKMRERDGSTNANLLGLIETLLS
jgi:hypothetical protein